MDARITPAYAGKSGLHDVLPVPAEDHPRLCGEKFVVSAFVRDFGGSPPPMRGKAFFHSFLTEVTRITPAYAGKSFFRRCGRYSGQDHPRLCGEKRRCIPRCSGAIGSPPPMRGKVVKLRHSRILMGITPAYAGKRVKSKG